MCTKERMEKNKTMDYRTYLKIDRTKASMERRGQGKVVKTGQENTQGMSKIEKKMDGRDVQRVGRIE